MSRTATRSLKPGLTSLAIVLALAILAVPAAAKAPVFNYPNRCEPTAGKGQQPPHIRAVCARSTTSAAPRATPAGGEHGGSDTAAFIAGSLVTFTVLVAGAMLAMVLRRDAGEGRAEPQS
jgi:hypothetical protein